MRHAHVTRHNKPSFPVQVPRFAVVCLLLLGAAATAHGAVYQVTKTQDTNDGACNADCSLREAILAANSNPGDDSVNLPAGRFTLTIPGADEDNCATGDLDITGSLSLTGQGPGETIIDATGLGDRVVHVWATGAEVILSALTVTGGSSPSTGGGIWHNAGHLVLSNVVVRDNQAESGGGVYSYLAEVTVQDGSVICDNTASADWYGGGLTGDNLTITDATVSGNQAGAGGGISTTGMLSISGSTIAYNRTMGYDGGGINAEGAEIEISNTTMVGNTSTRAGGAINAGGGTNLEMNGVTFSGNGALYGNTLRASGSNANWSNTLISGACQLESGATAVSNGGNLESPGSTCGLDDPSDHVNVADPTVAPLASYGGPTRTLLPKLGSPAIGNGLNANCLGVDQRGEPRSDGACDVGAVERQAGDQDPVFVDGFESGNTSAW